MPKISKQRLLARERGIVQAAVRCLQRNGLQGTGMRDLFRAANLSPGAVYRYFASKDELIAAVAAASPTIVEGALAATEDAGSREDRPRLLLEAAGANLPMARLQLELEAAALRSPLVAAALGERRRAARRSLTQALSEPGSPARGARVDLVVALCESLARSRLLDPQTEAAASLAAACQLLGAGSDVPAASRRD